MAMNVQQNCAAAADASPTSRGADRHQGVLRQFGGSQSDDWNDLIAAETVQARRARKPGPVSDREIDAAVAGLAGIGPRDELEGMMAAQLIAAHGAVMECYRRAMAHEEGRDENLRHAVRLTRAFVALHGALRRYRADAAKAAAERMKIAKQRLKPNGKGAEQRRPAAGMVRETRTHRAPVSDVRAESVEQPHAKGEERRRPAAGVVRGTRTHRTPVSDAHAESVKQPHAKEPAPVSRSIGLPSGVAPLPSPARWQPGDSLPAPVMAAAATPARGRLTALHTALMASTCINF
jgi:hypothetical protein